MTLRRTVLAAAAVASLATAAHAADLQFFSYDSENEPAKVLAETGFTFVFQRRMLSTRIEGVYSTGERGSARLKPVGEKVLGAGGIARLVGRKVAERAVYEIVPEGQGKALVRAACPGAEQGWLAMGELRIGLPLTIHVFGRDPGGKPRFCTTLEFSFHGEWRMPTPQDIPNIPQPTSPIPQSPQQQ